MAATATAAVAATKPIAIIAGAGAGTGHAIARRFARSYPVVLLARNPTKLSPLVDAINASGGNAVGIAADVSSVSSVKAAFGEISERFSQSSSSSSPSSSSSSSFSYFSSTNTASTSAGSSTGLPILAAAIFNVGGGFMRKPFLDLTGDEFEAGYEANGRGAFNFSQAVLPLLLDRAANAGSSAQQEQQQQEEEYHPPTLIFTGATASIKANAGVAAFASSKWMKRALSQSLAKEFGPRGVHVAHVVVDGVIDVPHTKGFEVGGGAPDAKISPDGIAEAYWNLHAQPRTNFTWELDIRPYVEKW
ncbi:MAG: hypothetical protein M1825_000195 [Sarcosagium campestre]|nr:MAG: hypothetical protein M1825_000195 [Sarcosagium campestre]